MKPIYENINISINTSVKIATYENETSCGLTNWHIHPEYELVYIKNGNGSLNIDTKTIPYKNGVLVFIGPNIPHANFSNNIKQDNIEVVIQMGENFLDDKISIFPEFRNIVTLFKNAEQILLFSEDVKTTLSKTFKGFKGMSTPKKLIHLIIILEHLSTTTQYKTYSKNRVTTKHRFTDITRLELIFDFINEHHSSKISTVTLANHVGLTTNSLCRFFKKMTHKSVIDFLNEYRIRKAVELLNNEPTQPISKIMYNCGYNDASYFTKQFKKYQKTTPSKFVAQRKLNRV